MTKILQELKNTIASISDRSMKKICQTLLSVIYSQDKVLVRQNEIIKTQNELIENQDKAIEGLEEKLNTNSDNSSKPPSTELFSANGKKDKSNGTSNGKRNRGGQLGHPGVTRKLLPDNQVDHIERHMPATNCHCGGNIKPGESYRRHQIHEIPPMKTVVTEHQLFYGSCDKCGQSHAAELPNNVSASMLGPRLTALIATFTGDYQVSKRKAAQLLNDIYQLTICAATVKHAEETVSEAISVPVEDAKKHVKDEPVVNCDETSHKECGKKMWAWVAIANNVAVFMIAKSRSAKVAKKLLGEGFKGILGSDRYSSYSWVAAAFRQVCWAHLKRDFKKISERTGKSKWIGLRLRVYIKRMFQSWHKVCDGTLTRKQFIKLMAPMRHKIESLLLAGTQSDHKKTQGTCREILKVKSALWTFIDKAGVEPTNNISERTLRQFVIWRKICFGTWSKNGTRYLERIMTVTATCHLQERSVFGFLCEAMQAHLDGSKPPSLLPS